MGPTKIGRVDETGQSLVILLCRCRPFGRAMNFVTPLDFVSMADEEPVRARNKTVNFENYRQRDYKTFTVIVVYVMECGEHGRT